MKKLLLFFVIFTFCIFTLSVSAETYQSYAITSKINTQIDSDTYAQLTNSSLYGNSMSGISLDNKPIVTVYNTISWNNAKMGLETSINNAKHSQNTDFLVFGEKIIRIRKFSKEEKTQIVLKEEYTELPTFIEDIAYCQSQNENSNDNALVGIICFDGIASNQGILSYYIYSDRTTVKYYENQFENALTFDEDDFKKISAKYYEYLTSDSYNYDKNGAPLYSGAMNFANFYKLNENTVFSSEANDPNYIFWGILCGVVLAVTVTISIIKVYVQRSSRKNRI